MTDTEISLARGRLIEKLRRQTSYSTRAAFCRRYNISEATLKHWERGISGSMSKSGLQKLVGALQNEGIICSEEYILSGGMQEQQGNAELGSETNDDPNLKTELGFFYKHLSVVCVSRS